MVANFEKMKNITQKLLPISKRRSGQKLLGISFIVSHDTANPGSTAQGNVNYFINSANEMEASAHYFVDDKDIIQIIPDSEKSWHVRFISPKDNEIYGKDANDWALGIELCYGGNIDNKKAYQNYVELHAYLCKKYKLIPEKKVVGHYALDPIRRNDPLNAFSVIGKIWADFIQDINDIMPKEDKDKEILNLKTELEVHRGLLKKMWKYIIALLSKK